MVWSRTTSSPRPARPDSSRRTTFASTTVRFAAATDPTCGCLISSIRGTRRSASRVVQSPMSMANHVDRRSRSPITRSLDRRSRRLLHLIAAVALIAGTAAPAFAQKYQNLGRAKCVNCHDHDNEKLWSEKKDGPPPNNHLNALKQMESSKSKGFADATGVKDVYDPGSSCVRCHATVVKGDTSGGITCESCHGPGSGYLDPHQKKDNYGGAVASGMNDFVKKPQNWARECVRCHVMDD